MLQETQIQTSLPISLKNTLYDAVLAIRVLIKTINKHSFWCTDPVLDFIRDEIIIADISELFPTPQFKFGDAISKKQMNEFLPNFTKYILEPRYIESNCNCCGTCTDIYIFDSAKILKKNGKEVAIHVCDIEYEYVLPYVVEILPQ